MIVLKGSLDEEVTPIFKILRVKWSCNRAPVLEHKAMSSNPNPTIQNKPKTKICTLLYTFLRLVYFTINKRNWSNRSRFYIQYCAEPIKKKGLW
jgi:hypothetical protein